MKILTIILIVFAVLVLFLFFATLFGISRDSAGFINECVGCNGDSERDCPKCSVRPELREWDPELGIEVINRKKGRK